jgi:hypothetical protein
MKATFFMAAAIVLASTAAIADPVVPRVAVVNLNSGIFKVIYKGAEASAVRMTILNSNDEVVFSETTRNVDGFMRKVNYSGMTAGEYTIEIEDKAGKTSQKVVYGSKSFVKNVHVAKLPEGQKYLLAVSNSGEEELNVRIFDGANNLVHTETRKIKGNFGMVYNLAAVSGTPTFEVIDATGSVRRIR